MSFPKLNHLYCCCMSKTQCQSLCEHDVHYAFFTGIFSTHFTISYASRLWKCDDKIWFYCNNYGKISDLFVMISSSVISSLVWSYFPDSGSCLSIKFWALFMSLWLNKVEKNQVVENYHALSFVSKETSVHVKRYGSTCTSYVGMGRFKMVSCT